MESTNITERGGGGADVPPPNVQRGDAEVRLAGADAVQGGLASLLYSSLLVLLVPLGLAVLLLIPTMATVTPSWDAGGRIGTTILVPFGLLVFDVLALRVYPESRPCAPRTYGEGGPAAPGFQALRRQRLSGMGSL